MLKMRFRGGVDPDVRWAYLHLARWLRRELDIRHEVRVYVHAKEHLAEEALPNGEAHYTWGLAHLPAPPAAEDEDAWEDELPPRHTMIQLAGDPEGWRRNGATRQEALDQLLHTFAHEMVHYEQWRDGRPITERNVNRRADALVRRYREEHAWCT